MPGKIKQKMTLSEQKRGLDIIAKIRKGDERAFGDLFKTYYKPLIKYACRYVPDVQTAEDIVCDVFLKIWEDRAQLNININTKSYLYRMARNHSLNYLKTKKPDLVDNYRLNLSLSSDAADEQVHLSEITKHIQEAIAELPDRSRSVFTMHRYDNLKYSEIAEILNISEGTVETHMVRALKFLRKRLDFLLSFILLMNHI